MTAARAKPKVKAAEKDPTGQLLLTTTPTDAAERRLCVRQAAGRATGADDLRHLLAVLGLAAVDGRPDPLTTPGNPAPNAPPVDTSTS
jgi:hypothetical protein